MFQPTIDPKSEFRSRWSIGDILLPFAIVAQWVTRQRSNQNGLTW